MSRALIVVSAVTLMLAAVRAQEPRSVFRTESDLVHFGVTVTDKRGTVIPGLTAADFEVMEDGKKQEVTYFAQGSEESAPELHAGLLFDTSGSMIEDLDLARSAAIKFLNRLPEAADLTLVDFDTEVRASRFSQADFPRLVERIRSRKSDGFTALYDAFAVYLERVASTPGRSVLVAFTDGGDSRSSMSYDDVIGMVKASNATIYVVGLIENQSGDLKGVQRLRLSRIADESGGQAIFPLSMKQIDSAYDQIVAELKAQYSLGYVSSDAKRDGRWREVKIRLLRKDLKDVRIRTRAGYFAPLDRPADR
jgi:Ca-activated chloride channel family protein